MYTPSIYTYVSIYIHITRVGDSQHDGASKERTQNRAQASIRVLSCTASKCVSILGGLVSDVHMFIFGRNALVCTRISHTLRLGCPALVEHLSLPCQATFHHSERMAFSSNACNLPHQVFVQEAAKVAGVFLVG